MTHDTSNAQIYSLDHSSLGQPAVINNRRPNFALLTGKLMCSVSMFLHAIWDWGGQTPTQEECTNIGLFLLLIYPSICWNRKQMEHKKKRKEAADIDSYLRSERTESVQLWQFSHYLTTPTPSSVHSGIHLITLLFFSETICPILPP